MALSSYRRQRDQLALARSISLKRRESSRDQFLLSNGSFSRHSFFCGFVNPRRCRFPLNTIDIFMKALQKVSKEFLRILLARKDDGNDDLAVRSSSHSRIAEKTRSKTSNGALECRWLTTDLPSAELHMFRIIVAYSRISRFTNRTRNLRLFLPRMSVPFITLVLDEFKDCARFSSKHNNKRGFVFDKHCRTEFMKH
jgi:hypothetical protein